MKKKRKKKKSLAQQLRELARAEQKLHEKRSKLEQQLSAEQRHTQSLLTRCKARK